MRKKFRIAQYNITTLFFDFCYSYHLNDFTSLDIHSLLLSLLPLIVFIASTGRKTIENKRSQFKTKKDKKFNNFSFFKFDLFKNVSFVSIKYSADINYPDKQTKLEISHPFFSNWFKIRQIVKRTKLLKISPEFLWHIFPRNSEPKFYSKNRSLCFFLLNRELNCNYQVFW